MLLLNLHEMLFLFSVEHALFAGYFRAEAALPTTRVRFGRRQTPIPTGSHRAMPRTAALLPATLHHHRTSQRPSLPQPCPQGSDPAPLSPTRPVRCLDRAVSPLTPPDQHGIWRRFFRTVSGCDFSDPRRHLWSLNGRLWRLGAIGRASSADCGRPRAGFGRRGVGWARLRSPVGRAHVLCHITG